MNLPVWDITGVIPPVRPGVGAVDPDRSPYRISVIELVDRFATSVERNRILEGFLTFRQGLHALGLVHGFQWVDGSFLEDVEDLEGRPPNDIDVVTFVYLPQGQTQITLLPHLQPFLDRASVKRQYCVDHYVNILPGVTIPAICYWYSMWSHRRDGRWKGFAQVDLSGSDDAQACRKQPPYARRWLSFLGC